MKKLLLSFTIIFASMLIFTSCKKETVQESLEQRLSKDATFKKALVAAADFGSSAKDVDLNSEENIQMISTILEKHKNGTSTANDLVTAENILGISLDKFMTGMNTMSNSLVELNNKFPELSKMSSNEVQNIVSKAIKLNPTLEQDLKTTAIKNLNGRVDACPLRDICKLAVTLTNLFAGQTICAAINVSTIPVVGGILCQIILTLGTGILNGICDALPC